MDFINGYPHIETTKDYKKYEEQVEQFFFLEGIANLSRVSSQEESWFSWRPCECCKRSLGGDRITASGYHKETGTIFEYDICLDCEYYAEYGQLDDMTMLDLIEE